MDLIPLPVELIDKVIGFCPQNIQYSLLKSKTFAQSAYKHYYKRVIFKNNNIDDLLLDYDSEYVDDHLWLLRVGFERKYSVNNRPKKFVNAKSLLIFYKTHPLYNPDTIIISDNEQLETLHRLKPGFLKKFKNIDYTALTETTLPSKFMDLRFGTFVSRQTTSLPNSITKLELRDCDFGAPPNIQELKLDGVDVDFDDLKQLRYLRKLTLVNYEEDVVISHPTLANLALEDHKGEVDITGCVKLADFELSFQVDREHDYCGPKEYTLGFDVNDTYRLPPNLIFLLLEEVPYSPTLANLSQFETLQSLEISLNDENKCSGVIDAPPNLMCLVIKGGNSGSDLSSDLSCNIPQKLTYLELTDLKCLGFIQLPESLIYLNLKNFKCCLHDYSHLKNLKTIHPAYCDCSFQEKFKLPQLIENYQYVGYCSRFQDMDFAQFHNLKSVISEELCRVVLPDLMRLLTTGNHSPTEIEGGSNLQKLDFEEYEAHDSSEFDFNFKNLISLSLKGHYDGYLCRGFIPPETLRYLFLRDVILESPLVCPPHLKYLCIVDSSFEKLSAELEALVLNDELEVLELESWWPDWSHLNKLLKNLPKSLIHMSLTDMSLENIKVDLRNTQLETLTMKGIDDETSESQSYKIKLPKTLKRFSYSLEDYSPPKFSDWVDISECDQLCVFDIPNFVYEDPKDAERFQKLKDFANDKINSID